MDNARMTVDEAKAFLAQMRLTVVNRQGSNYDEERYLRVECSSESTWGGDTPGGPAHTKAKFEEAVRVLTGV